MTIIDPIIAMVPIIFPVLTYSFLPAISLLARRKRDGAIDGGRRRPCRPVGQVFLDCFGSGRQREKPLCWGSRGEHANVGGCVVENNATVDVKPLHMKAVKVLFLISFLAYGWIPGARYTDDEDSHRSAECGNSLFL